jgi:hypothetical protein
LLARVAPSQHRLCQGAPTPNSKNSINALI